MSKAANRTAGKTGWEHFPHDADIGVRGFGNTPAEAFEQAALALTAVVTDAEVAPRDVTVTCAAPDLELLFVEWLNAVIYEMAVRSMLFGRFAVRIDGDAARRNAVGRAGRRRPPSAGVRTQGRDLHRAQGGRERRRWRWSATPASSTYKEPEAMDPSRFTRVDDDDLADRAAGRHARAGHHLCRRGPHPRHGRQGRRAGQPTSRRCRASSGEPTPCPTRIGATASRSAASPPSIRTRAAWSPPAASASTFPAACAPADRPRRSPTSMPVQNDAGRIACSARSRPASAARAPSRSTTRRWTRCSRAAPVGGRRGWGDARDLERIEEGGRMAGAEPGAGLGPRQEAPARRDGHARLRQPLSRGAGGRRDLRRRARPAAFGLAPSDVVVTIHCGSRGLGHQIGTEFLKRDGRRGGRAAGIALPDRELACAPINSDARPALSRRDARRHQLRARQPRRSSPTSRARSSPAFFPGAELALLFDVSHNTCKVEPHSGRRRARASCTSTARARRAPSGPATPACRRRCARVGQPVLIGGSMGTGSYVLAGRSRRRAKAFFVSACHGAGRAMSRHQARQAVEGARDQSTSSPRRASSIRSPSMRGVAEEAPGAYKDVGRGGRWRPSGRPRRGGSRACRPLICIKG